MNYIEFITKLDYYYFRKKVKNVKLVVVKFGEGERVRQTPFASSNSFEIRGMTTVRVHHCFPLPALTKNKAPFSKNWAKHQVPAGGEIWWGRREFSVSNLFEIVKYFVHSANLVYLLMKISCKYLQKPGNWGN